MGHNQSNEGNPEATKRFSNCELNILKNTYRELANKSEGKKCIDKDTFLKVFPLPGLLGERLFAVFNSSKSGAITMDEFINGLCICCRGSNDEKMKFIFHEFDLSDSNSVTPAQLRTLLNHIPHSVVDMIDHHALSDVELDQAESLTEHAVRVDELVKQAFDECDLDHDGKLNFEEFKRWLCSHPEVTLFLSSVFPYDDTVNLLPPSGSSTPHDRKASLLPFNRSNSRDSFQLARSHSRDFQFNPRMSPKSSESLALYQFYCENCENCLRFCSKCGCAFTGETMATHTKSGWLVSCHSCHQQAEHIVCCCCGTKRDSHAFRLIVDDESSDGGSVGGLPSECSSIMEDQMLEWEGFLFKRSRHIHVWKRRWYFLHGNFLYYYRHMNDSSPAGVVFLDGCFVDCADDDQLCKGYYGIDIASGSDPLDRRRLYAKDPSERQTWVELLRKASKVVPFEDHYELGDRVGTGRFSNVHRCVSRATKDEWCVKIIDKTNIESSEKELLRTEIAILKLVDHPHILRMVDVFESRQHLYIVTELLRGGELFDRIVGRSRFSEREAHTVLLPLIEGVAYMHDLGIVHRDIKPENILCGDDLSQIKIADFGLSKICTPEQTMNLPCGTLSYVAPEVLMMKGYDNEADLWSVGVIMYLLLEGHLPFDGRSKHEVIQKTMNSKLLFSKSKNHVLSADCLSLIRGLLEKNPQKRLTARAALEHPWIQKFKRPRRTGSMSPQPPRRGEVGEPQPMRRSATVDLNSQRPMMKEFKRSRSPAKKEQIHVIGPDHKEHHISDMRQLNISAEGVTLVDFSSKGCRVRPPLPNKSDKIAQEFVIPPFKKKKNAMKLPKKIEEDANEVPLAEDRVAPAPCSIAERVKVIKNSHSSSSSAFVESSVPSSEDEASPFSSLSGSMEEMCKNKDEKSLPPTQPNSNITTNSSGTASQTHEQLGISLDDLTDSFGRPLSDRSDVSVTAD